MIYRIENINNPNYTEALYEKAYNEMSYERKQKADRYKNIADKKLCVFSDMLLREMLKDTFGIEAPEFYINEKGKPCLMGNNLHFSISHSGSFVACAVDTSPVGIDIEIPRPINKRMLDHCFTNEEVRFIVSDLSSLPDSIPADSPETHRFLSMWTAKEAYLKFTGEGLGGGLKNIVTIEDGKLKSSINNKQLITIHNNDYVLSIITQIT